MTLTANSQHLARIGEKKLFHELDVHDVNKVRNQTFLGSPGRNDSNSHQLTRIGDKKIFHELDGHDV